jgi:hypothetical protein
VSATLNLFHKPHKSLFMAAHQTRPRPIAAAAILVHARIHKLYFPNAPRSRLTLFESLAPDGSGVYCGVVPLTDRDTFGCSTVIALRTIPTKHHQLIFVINEFQSDLGDVELARLVLPLEWFPPDKVVSYVYPMITRRAQETAPMIALDIHISSGATRPFIAPEGQMRVVPAWEAPGFLFPKGEPEISQRAPPPISISGLIQEELFTRPPDEQ